MATGSTKRPAPRPVRYKLLSTCSVGGNELRFLSVNENNGAASFPTTVEDVRISIYWFFIEEFWRKYFAFVLTVVQNGGFEKLKIDVDSFSLLFQWLITELQLCTAQTNSLCRE